MPDDDKTAISFSTFEDAVKSAQVTFEDLKKILDQLEPRSYAASSTRQLRDQGTPAISYPVASLTSVSG